MGDAAGGQRPARRSAPAPRGGRAPLCRTLPALCRTPWPAETAQRGILARARRPAPSRRRGRQRRVCRARLPLLPAPVRLGRSAGDAGPARACTFLTRSGRARAPVNQCLQYRALAFGARRLLLWSTRALLGFSATVAPQGQCYPPDPDVVG